MQPFLPKQPVAMASTNQPTTISAARNVSKLPLPKPPHRNLDCPQHAALCIHTTTSDSSSLHIPDAAHLR